MTIQNLATIFGPTLFNLASPKLEKESTVRKRFGIIPVSNNMGLMEEAKQTAQLAATAVAILIERATWIGEFEVFWRYLVYFIIHFKNKCTCKLYLFH